MFEVRISILVGMPTTNGSFIYGEGAIDERTMSVCGPYVLCGRTIITQGISKQCVLPTAAIRNVCALSDSGMPLTRLTTSS